MGRRSIKEYAERMRERYEGASKAEKGRLLDEFCATTGYHRKAAVRLLCRGVMGSRRGGRRQRRYGPEVAAAVKVAWEAVDRIGAKRLAPFLPELVAQLERHGELAVPAPVREALLQVSAATIDRLLRPWRRTWPRRPHTGSPASAHLKAQVPIRTFGEWRGVAPGALQADLVAHCGESTEGFYLTTLTTVDVATGWTEYEPVWGKGQQRVGSAVHRTRQRLPFPLRELHTDNGSEFLNHVLYPWCQREGIRLTRGRPYRKNDQAYVEQRNWWGPRRLVGYQRFSSEAAYQQLGRVYETVNLYINFFQPISKLVHKERTGAQVRKEYDVAQTPYQRLLAAGLLTTAEREALEVRYAGLNPVRLRAQFEAALEVLWRLADPPQAHPTPAAGASGAQMTAGYVDSGGQPPTEASVGNHGNHHREATLAGAR